MCKVIAIANQKGGVGKTTTSLNFGVGLAKSGKKVLLIDCDAQASLTLAFGYRQPDELPVTLSTVMARIMNDEEIEADYGILRHEEGIDLMPASIELSALEVSLINATCREMILRTYIEALKPQYDYIIIDCMPSLGMLTINALAAADSVIIPSQPHFLSAKGLELLLGSIAKTKKKINPQLAIGGILMTMVNSNTNFSRDMIDLLKTQYGEFIPIFTSLIPQSIRATEASAAGMSIYKYDGKGKIAAAYECFVAEYLKTERA